jgi:hypothetical protein
MVSIAAFQAVDPGSIPGHRNFLERKNCVMILATSYFMDYFCDKQ